VKILIVKLSSLGDVVHAMPALQDIRSALPDAQVDWVIERAFMPLVSRCDGVGRIIGCELRRWRKSPLESQTREEWRTFRRELREQPYDAVIDLQGLIKSGLIARAARLTPTGKRYAIGNRTEDSGYEFPTRWFADVAIRIELHVHAVTRARQMCASALGYAVEGPPRFGLHAARTQEFAGGPSARCVALVHGTSRDDKCWPEAHWVEFARRLMSQGFTLGLPHGSDAERERSERIARALGDAAQVWPRMDLGRLTDWLAGCAGVVGVDSGLSHVAVALDRPHVQIYNFETGWRTGPHIEGVPPGPQRIVYAQPTPSVDAVWQAWQEVSGKP
jgi:heptosyltransferase I